MAVKKPYREDGEGSVTKIGPRTYIQLTTLITLLGFAFYSGGYLRDNSNRLERIETLLEDTLTVSEMEIFMNNLSHLNPDLKMPPSPKSRFQKKQQ